MEAGVFFGVANFARSAPERLAMLAQHNIAFGPAIPLRQRQTMSRAKLSQIFAVWAERQRVRDRVAQIQREVAQERKQRESEKQAEIFARAQGKGPSPVPQSGVAGEMKKLLEGQALFDPGAGRILKNLGLKRGGLNSSWRGPIYSDAADATLDSTVPQAMPGRREKTAAPRLRG